MIVIFHVDEIFPSELPTYADVDIYEYVHVLLLNRHMMECSTNPLSI